MSSIKLKGSTSGEVTLQAPAVAGDTVLELPSDSGALVVVPIGGIIMFSGTISELPSSWELCDGTNGTPDLRGRFVVGSEGEYSQGDTGGATSVTLTTAHMPSHNHGFLAGTVGSAAQSSGGGRLETLDGTGLGRRTSGTEEITLNTAINPAGSGDAHENRPPYYALAYIMRVA